MYKKLLPFIFTISVVSGFFIFKRTGFRTEYDRYLAKKYIKAVERTRGGEDNLAGMEGLDLAAVQNWFMTYDPALERVPGERLAEAYQKVVEKEGQYSKSTVNFIDWVETGSNMGGRMRGIMWDPDEDNKVWACSVTGGLWYNEDITGINSWQPVNDFWPGLATNCIAYDPNDPDIFYVGTGEYHTARVIYRESSGVGYGIWKSTDGGETWEVIPSTSDFKYITDIVVIDQNGTSVIYAGVASGIYHGVNHLSEPSDGLYRSYDGGNTWEQVLPDISGTGSPFAPADIEVSPNGRIFIGTMKNLDFNGGATILYSDSGDPGTWEVFDYYETIIPNDPEYPVPGRVVLGVAPSDPDIVYAIVGAGWLNSAGFNYARGKYVLRSDDGGETWEEKPLPGGSEYWASLSWHAFEITVNPEDPDNVFVGGLDLWKSLNGGNTWYHVSDWSLMYSGGGYNYVHADQHWGRYKPGSSTTAIFSSDGGIFYSENADINYPTFVEKSKGLSTLQFYVADIYPVDNQFIFIGGLQDNGSLLYQGAPLDLNDMVDGADGTYCFFDETQPQFMITSVYYNSYTLFINFNQSLTFGEYGTGVFINPADYDSKNNILYANKTGFDGSSANKILRFSGIPNPVNSTITLTTGLSTYFSNIKVSPHAPEGTTTLFVGSQNGRLFKVTNAQATPSTVEIGAEDFPAAYISCIETGGSEDTLIVTFSNYGVSKVWQTYDGGENWTDITNNLPDIPVRWALYHPQNAKQVILATELGVWITDDASQPGFEWEHDTSFPNVRIDNMQVRKSDNTVLLATHGRGMWYGTWNYIPNTGIDSYQSNVLSVFPVPSSGVVNISLKEKGLWEVFVYDVTGKMILTKRFESVSDKKNTLDLSEYPKGMYLVSVKQGAKQYSGKVIIK